MAHLCALPRPAFEQGTLPKVCYLTGATENLISVPMRFRLRSPRAVLVFAAMFALLVGALCASIVFVPPGASPWRWAIEAVRVAVFAALAISIKRVFERIAPAVHGTLTFDATAYEAWQRQHRRHEVLTAVVPMALVRFSPLVTALHVPLFEALAPFVALVMMFENPLTEAFWRTVESHTLQLRSVDERFINLFVSERSVAESVVPEYASFPVK